MEEQTPTTEAPKASLTLPVAVVIAGVLIAGAVVFSRAGGGVPQVAIASLPLGQELYVALAKDLRIKEKDFIACQSDATIAAKVQADYQNAIDSGGTGTPFSVVIAKDGKRAIINGALPFDRVKETIDQAIAGTLPPLQNEKIVNMRPVDATDHLFGNPTADVIIVEYSDFQCPFCTRFHPVVKQVLATVPGEVRWVYRHFPLTNIHPEAKPAAIASECVAKLKGNDAFFTYVDGLFAAKAN